jgi:hypothetical protein
MKGDLDKALAGDERAMTKNFRQMIGALNKVDVDQPEYKDFVKRETLSKLAAHVIGRSGVDAEGRTGEGVDVQKALIGQGIAVTVSRCMDGKGDRAMVTFEKDGCYLYISPPSLAVRSWANHHLGVKD